MSHKPTLKQFGDLKPTDFVEHPVWVMVHVIDYDEPWHDETDEETFRPWTGTLPVDPQEAIFLVRAKLTFADGQVLQGFVTPQADAGPADFGTRQPNVFLPSGVSVSFWCSIFKPDPAELREFYSGLGKDPAQTFPIRYETEPGLAMGFTEGEIPGFCLNLDGEMDFFH